MSLKFNYINHPLDPPGNYLDRHPSPPGPPDHPAHSENGSWFRNRETVVVSAQTFRTS